MGLHPSEVIYVGDALTDARAAVDAECRAAIGVFWGGATTRNVWRRKRVSRR